MSTSNAASSCREIRGTLLFGCSTAALYPWTATERNKCSVTRISVAQEKNQVGKRARTILGRKPPSARHVGPSADAPVQLLRKGDGWVAVDKPANMLCHRNEKLAKGESVFVIDTVRRMLADELSGGADVRVVHRLDRATSGVMLFAVGSPSSAARLQARLQDKSMTRKEYWTIARCVPGALSDNVHWSNRSPLKNISKSKSSEQQDATTNFETLARFSCYEDSMATREDRGVDGSEFNPHEIAVLRAVLDTGRRHQIRRHLSYSKCPILGDTTYGRGTHNRDARRRYNVSRLALHSRRLQFLDPAGNGSDPPIVVESPVPADLREVLSHVPGFDFLEHATSCDLGNSQMTMSQERDRDRE